MTDAFALIRDWLDATTLGPESKFVGMATPDIAMQFPYIPAGWGAEEVLGIDAVVETFRKVWQDFSAFEWYDVDIRKMEGDEVYVTTARSRATRTAGNAYGNRYVMFTRLRDGKVAEHIEYFNPAATTA